MENNALLTIAGGIHAEVYGPVERKRELVSNGEDYATDELKDAGVKGLDVLLIGAKCKATMERKLDVGASRRGVSQHGFL